MLQFYTSTKFKGISEKWIITISKFLEFTHLGILSFDFVRMREKLFKLTGFCLENGRCQTDVLSTDYNRIQSIHACLLICKYLMTQFKLNANKV